MQIFVDADACPVVDIVESIAEKYNIPTTLLCDTNHVLYSDYSKVIVVGAGADAVDYKLIGICHKGDVVEVDGKSITLNQDTPAGHKVLIVDAPEGTDIIKYGYPIGHATADLKAGDWVNENNLKTNLKGTLTYAYEPVEDTLDIPVENRTFEGYVRKNGEVGVRNEIWIVPRPALRRDGRTL